MGKFLILVLISLAVLTVNCATEQAYISGEKCDAPIWNDGDSWKFIGGGQVWEEKFVGATLRQTPQKGFYGIFNIPFVGLKIFPLWVGKKVSGTQTAPNIEGVDLTYTYLYKVINITEIKVEAGTFKVYKIELKISPILYNLEQGIAHFYYSPETKSIVKFETKSHILYKWENYELSSFTLKDKPLKVSHSETKPPPGVMRVPKPQLMEGDTWVRQSDRGKFTWEIEKVDDSGMILRQGKNEYYYDNEFAEIKKMRSGKTIYELSPPYKGWQFFPLWVGKKWENNFAENDFVKGTKYNFHELVEVKDWEDIQTPVGTFKTLKIEIIRSNLDTRGHWNYTVWYSPEVKANIKSFSKDSPHRNWTLAEFKLEKMGSLPE